MINVICILFSLFVLSTSSAQTVNGLRQTVTIKEYVDMQATLNKEWSEKYMAVQFENIKENVRTANLAMEKRLDAINEFRGQLKDQAGTFITRSELFGYVIGIIGIIFGIMNLQRKKVEGLKT